jgi:hypothetical protein
VSAGAGDEDRRLLEELRRLFQDTDPLPEQATRLAKASYGWRTLDAELAALTHDSLVDQAPLAMRGAAPPRLLAFDAADLRVEVEVETLGAGGAGAESAGAAGGQRRLLGQLVPPQPARIEARDGAGGRRTVEADEAGRFAIDPLPAGPLSLWCVRPGSPPVATEWFRA